MKSIVGALAALLCVVLLSVYTETSVGAQVAPPAPKPLPSPTAPVLTEEQKVAAVERIPLRQRLEMGLTLNNLRQTAKELKKEGIPVTAENLRDRLAENAPKAYSVQAPNWDNILAFIEKLLPLILKLIDLFAVETPAAPALDAPALSLLSPSLLLGGGLFYRGGSSCASCTNGACPTEASAAPPPAPIKTVTRTVTKAVALPVIVVKPVAPPVCTPPASPKVQPSPQPQCSVNCEAGPRRPVLGAPVRSVGQVFRWLFGG